MPRNPEVNVISRIFTQFETLQRIVPEQINKPFQITSVSSWFVDPTRLMELKVIHSEDFDLTKLIEYCEELNKVSTEECFLAIPMLGRAIIDHVPPIFGCKNFAEVANNYPGGSKSFKQSMEHLENSTRKIADSYLHVQIRKSEVLPNRTQVNFSADLDVLLSEITRVLKNNDT